MISKTFNSICNGCVQELRSLCPEYTGNLKTNAVQFRYVSADTFEIYIDEAIAPYMKYTNEDWAQFKPPLQGKQNPNQGWFERATEIVAKYIAKRLKGTLKKDDNA